ncbi:MAG: isoprenylcysteine carboxylmethyltransferase family protein [Caldilineaceae bacterium]|nr:isoprenylcysteine carboxylmethyltransferase family protein [Caldilineaceae bacterium]
MMPTMPSESAHHSYFRTADIVFGVPFLVALILQWVVPVSLPRGLLGPALILGGAGLSAVGVASIVLARREFARLGQPTDPGHPTSKLVTTGVFSVSRNPLYLGVVCFLVGVALAVNLPWVLVLLLPSLVACQYVLIAPEERYLSAKFGTEYQEYVATVQRWIGRTRRSRYR